MTPDPRRGLLSLTWTSASSNNNNNNNSGSGGILKVEWKDRRTRTVVDTLTIFPQDDCTYSKVETGNHDRVYLLQFGNSSDRRFFYWMQDKYEEGKDEDNCVKLNMYMADPIEAAKAAGEEVPTTTTTTEEATTTEDVTTTTDAAATTTTTTTTPAATTTNTSGDLNMSGLGGGGLDNAALMQVMQGLGSTDSNNNNNNTTTTSSSQPPQGQVDALSNILENLGMPQPGTTNNVTTTTPATTSSGGGTLTLADLQGAMAGLATTSPTTVPTTPAVVGPPLSEIASSDSIMESGILSDETVKAKLIQLLPEEQRSEQYLEENLRSPQVSQCLKQLTATLSEDHDSLSSVLANFHLPPPPPGTIITNPIQTFLDSVLQSVQDDAEKKKGDKTQDTKSDGNNNDGK